MGRSYVPRETRIAVIARGARLDRDGVRAELVRRSPSPVSSVRAVRSQSLSRLARVAAGTSSRNTGQFS